MRFRTLAVAMLAMAALGVSAQPLPDAGMQRQQLAEQRRAVEAAHTQRVADCQRRFAVTACLDEARADRRRALEPLRERELALDARERTQRAEQRRREVERKQRELAARPVLQEPVAAPAENASDPRREAREPPPPRGSPSPELEVRSREREVAAGDRSREAAERAERRREREAAGQARRDKVVERQMERSLRGKNAEPLPAAGRASAATSAR
jgi:hypothetical protein